MKPFLCVNALQVGYGKRDPLFREPLSFAIPEGKLTALIGKNGEGKSTFFQTLLGEDHVLSGEILFDFATSKEDRWRQIAYVPQDHPFQASLLVSDFLALAFLPELGFFGRLSPAHHERIQSKLSEMQLTAYAQKRMGAISAGERQRVFLARALLQSARILLLDEPTNHLDPASRELFWIAVQHERKARPIDVLVISHDMQFLTEHVEWVVALKDRSLLFCGSKQSAVAQNIFKKTYWT